MVRRYDAGGYRKAQKTPEGFLRADALITRTGVFPYRNADGSIRRELRLPEEVFHADALASFEGKPVTDDHPEQPVTAENARELGRGHVGEGVRRDGDHVLAPVTITDADLVGKVESGKVQLSCGYDCDLEMRAGEHQGERYDAIQRNIRGNHVAVVDRGRAGPSVRVRLDAGDAEQVADAPTKEPKVKIRIDGVDYDPSQTEQIAQALEKLKKKHADALEALKSELAAKTSELEKVTARADTAEGALKKAEKGRADAEDPKRLDALVNARLELVGAAREVLGADFKVDGLDVVGIRKAVLAKLAPDLKLDGCSEDYVAARFDGEMDAFRARSSGVSQLRRVVTPPPVRNDGKFPGQRDTLEQQRADFHEFTETLWQRPLSKHGPRPESDES